MKTDIEPCELVEHENGQYSLILSDNNFIAYAPIFEEMGWEGGGYNWAGVADSLVRMKAPALAEKLSYDPEAGMFAAVSEDREALEQVGLLLRSAMNDPELLREAIEKADPERMD